MRLGLAGSLVVFTLTVVVLSGGPPAALGAVRVASLSFTAIVATLTAVVSWTLVLLYHRVPRPATRVAAPFVALVACMFGSLLIGGATRQGLQFILVEVAFLGALLLASTARRVVGSHLESVLARCFRLTSTVLIAAAILGAADPALKVSTRPSAMVALIGMGWFLAEYRLGKRPSLWWSLAILLAIALSLSRTALFAAFALLLLTMLLAVGRN